MASKILNFTVNSEYMYKFKLLTDKYKLGCKSDVLRKLIDNSYYSFFKK
jgi:hypothetical protein